MSIVKSPRRFFTPLLAAALLALSSVLVSPTANAATAYTTAELTLRAGTSTATAALGTIPANVALDVQCQAKGQRISGTYNSDWWAKVSYNGKTGYLSRAYVRVPYGSSVAVCGSSSPAPGGGNATTTAELTVRAGTSTATAALTSIPANTSIHVQCQAKGQAVQGTYNSDWWAKVNYNGKTGYVSRAYVRVPYGTNIGTCSGSVPPPPAAPGTITRAEVFNRARNWLNRRIPYSMYNWVTGPDSTRYRTDCSGFVSMAFRTGTSYSTVTLTNRFYRINKNDLRPGDIVGNLGPGSGGANGHVVIFNGWTDGSKTTFRTIEQTPNYTQERTARWGSAFYLHAAWRFDKIAD